MLTLTAEQVRTLAPDTSAARAGEALADPRRWSGNGRTDTAVWGLCQGSGSSPYQVAVDMGGPAYKCSCPSRKIPCKHSLGLLFLQAGGSIGHGEVPDWVSTWLESRATRATASATRAERTAETDPALRAKRAESRERKVAAGIDELDRWLVDLMRRGLDSVRAEGYRPWDAMGARLVDAQAGGLGRSVRALGSAASAGDLWPHLLLDGTSRLHLLTQAYRRLDQLPEPLRADVRTLIGWTIREDELDSAESVNDRWLVVGQRVDDTGQVITARTFFLGERTGRFALHNAFGVGAAPPTLPAVPGQAIRATLTFYPSATPLRAIVRPVLEPDGDVTVVSGTHVADVVEDHARRLAVNPFLLGWPVALGEVVPVIRDAGLLIRDEGRAALRVAPSSLGPRLLAVSGGHPVTAIGEWDGSILRILSVVTDGRLVSLEIPDGTSGPRREPDPEWASLVSAALLGTERAGDTLVTPEAARSLVRSNGGGREHLLLTAAGVLALRRRAGRTAELDEAPLPQPSPDDSRPALRGDAARLFGLVVTEGSVLLPEVLDLVAQSGRRLPDEWLPEILAAAADEPAVAEQVARLAGPRAAWLSDHVPDLAAFAPLAADADWPRALEAATGKARVALFTSMRQTDPARARAALEASLPDLAGADRAPVIGALATNLRAEDEELLVSALADSRADVRRTAASLLVRVEGSALAELVRGRARQLLRSQGRLRPSLAVTLSTLDDELESAGFDVKPPAGLGARAWLLRQLIAGVRPSNWEDWLEADAPALVGRALRSEDARPVLEGWIEAASRFDAPEWLALLASEPKVREIVKLDLLAAISALPVTSRAVVVSRVAKTIDGPTMPRLVALSPPTWPTELADAVLGRLEGLGSVQYPDQTVYELVRVAARGLSPDRSDELTAVASHEGQIRAALVGAVETIRLRARIHAAFANLPSPT